ncbi:30S ribosomal protein S13, partial [Candidatus Woesearchaeota archaeon]|nr:30S ribosomal protein S13 [Candidatus Woesearchaeota archaeon]
SFMLANVICKLSGVDKNQKVGYFPDSEVAKIEQVLTGPLKSKIPNWMLNRRKDPETGEDGHILGADLKFAQESDIRQMRKIKCYKGMRHSFGLPARGQRTKSNFRRNKGKVMGVARSKQAKKK